MLHPLYCVSSPCVLYLYHDCMSVWSRPIQLSHRITTFDLWHAMPTIVCLKACMYLCYGCTMCVWSTQLSHRMTTFDFGMLRSLRFSRSGFRGHTASLLHRTTSCPRGSLLNLQERIYLCKLSNFVCRQEFYHSNLCLL